MFGSFPKIRGPPYRPLNATVFTMGIPKRPRILGNPGCCHTLVGVKHGYWRLSDCRMTLRPSPRQVASRYGRKGG